jgi:hypothetical protein
MFCMSSSSPDAVPGHVADDERDPRAGQPDRLVPVAADLDQLAAGQVTVADVDRGRVGQPGRQHRPLQGERGRVLSVVPGGVVEEDRLAAGEVHRHFHVVAVEPAGPELTEAAEQADDLALGDGREDQHRGVGQQPADRLAAPGPGELLGRLRGDGRLQDRRARLDGPGVGRAGREAEDLADRERGLPGRVLLVVLDVQPPERDVRVGAVRGDLVVADQRLEDEHLGGGAEGRHELLGHLLGEVAEVERVLVGGARVAQQDLAHQARLDEPLARRDRDLQDHEGGDVAAAGRHRPGGDHRAGDGAVRQRDREHVIRLAVGLDRLEQPGDHEGGALVGRDGGTAVLGLGRGNVGEVDPEQVIARTCENLGSRAVMLNDPAGAVDAKDKRPHRG